MKHIIFKITFNLLFVCPSLIMGSARLPVTQTDVDDLKTAVARKKALSTKISAIAPLDLSATTDPSVKNSLIDFLNETLKLAESGAATTFLPEFFAGNPVQHAELHRMAKDITLDASTKKAFQLWRCAKRLLAIIKTIPVGKRPTGTLPSIINIEHIVIGEPERGLGAHIFVCGPQFVIFLRRGNVIEINIDNGVACAPPLASDSQSKSAYPLLQALIRKSTTPIKKLLDMNPDQQDAVAAFIRLIINVFSDRTTIVAKGPGQTPERQQLLVYIPGLGHHIEIILEDEHIVITAYPIYNVITLDTDTSAVHKVINSKQITTLGQAHPATVNDDDFGITPAATVVEYFMTHRALIDLIRANRLSGTPAAPPVPTTPPTPPCYAPCYYRYIDNHGVNRTIYDIAPALASATIAKEIEGRGTVSGALTCINAGIYVSIPTDELP